MDYKIITVLTKIPYPNHLYSRIEIIHQNGKGKVFDFAEVISCYTGKIFKRIHIDGSIAWIYCQNTPSLLCCSLKPIAETALPMIYIENED
jgi:hypothetical protein